MYPPPDTPIQGAVIIGTAPKCGKTVMAAGLAAALNDAGLRIEALKPLSFKSSQRLKPDQDQAYLNRLTGQMETFQPIELATHHDMSPVLWRRFLETCRQPQYPAFIELPGSAAAPVMFQTGHGETPILDAADVAHLLNLPVILVTAKHPALLAHLLPSLVYLKEKGVDLIGWAAAECLSIDAPYWDEETLYISQTYECAYLGSINYSPSISVELLRPGNLVPQAQIGLDLLPVQIAMKLLVP